MAPPRVNGISPKEGAVENEIVGYFHCRKCLKVYFEKQLKCSPADYQRLEVGWTPTGIQVWCKRHDSNVISIDFPTGAAEESNPSSAGD
jgi:hypothetical protein